MKNLSVNQTLAVKKNLFVKLLLLPLVLFSIGVGNVWGAEDDTAYTLTCTQNSSNTAYANTFNVTINSKNWSAPGNQYAGSGWRVGGAKGTNVSRYITGKSTIDKPIKKITVNHNGRSNANLTINSFSVTVSKNSDFSSPIETKTVTSPSVSSAGSFDLTPTSSPWPSGCYYKFTLVYTHNKSSNYGLDLTSLVFVEGASGSTKTLLYDDNGADGGTVPTDAAAYNVGDKATVKGNTGGLYKIGHTFAGWTDNSAGTGTVYTSGDKFTIASSGNTLYAKWTNTYAGNEFSLVEDLTDLSAGSKIIIIGTDAGGTNFYALKTTQQTDYRDRVASGTSEFTMSNSNKTCTLGASTNVQVITLEDLATPVSNTYQFNVENGYLYAAGGTTNNYLRTQVTNTTSGYWLIGLSDGVFSIVAQNGGASYHNAMYHNNGSTRFSCYLSGAANMLPVKIYVKDEGTKYAITWANGGHGTAPTSPTNASKVTLPELSESGWQHTGWIADKAVTNVSTSSSISAGTLITNGTRVQLGAATTFTAQWKQICATPTFSVSAGTYNATQTVSISCATPSGCTIRYTTDGSTPTSSSGTVYSSAITVSVSQTINAIAYKDGCVDSEVASAAYTLKCATPTFDPAAGTKSGAQSVTISCASEGATIYYTTDNTTPSTGSTEYSGAIPVSESETIKAIAVIDGWTNSDVASAAYTINYSVTWKVNGETWTSGVSSSNNNANWNTKISAMPTAPTPSDACGDKFMGWTTTNIGSTGLDKTDDAAAITALSLFTDVAGSPAITEATTFYAVFADYAEDGE